MGKMKRALTLLLSLLPLAGAAQTVSLPEQVEVTRLSERVWLHVSRAQIAGFGMVSSNGLIVVRDNEAVLLDTPTTEAQTDVLLSWMADSLRVRPVAFVPNHWHGDCMGGLECLHRIGTVSWAQHRTIELARGYGLSSPENGFGRRKVLWLNDMQIVCRYFGSAHSSDNIVVWIPSERILFAGCMVKETAARTLGNLSEGARPAKYGRTIRRVMRCFPDARIVVPGHGAVGGRELLEHTLRLTKESR